MLHCEENNDRFVGFQRGNTLWNMSDQTKAATDVTIRQFHRASVCTPTGILRQSSASTKCLYTNVCSMGNRQEELEIRGQSQVLDPIVFTDTWWDSSCTWNVVMKDYSLFRRDRLWGHNGGVALCVRQHLKSIKLCLGVSEEWADTWHVRKKGQTSKNDFVKGMIQAAWAGGGNGWGLLQAAWGSLTVTGTGSCGGL